MFFIILSEKDENGRVEAKALNELVFTDCSKKCSDTLFCMGVGVAFDAVVWPLKIGSEAWAAIFKSKVSQFLVESKMESNFSVFVKL